MKSKISMCLCLLFAVVVFLSNHVFSQNKGMKLDDLLTVEKTSAIIDKIIDVFNEYYPLPNMAVDMTKFINQKRQDGEYNQFTDLAKFTSQLQIDLRSISNDLHIRVWPYEKIPEDLLVEIKLGSPEDNYGFQKVERLLGNIGYIELTTFNNTKSAGLTAIAAMNFVAHCDALIIDLRLNGGGDESMAQFLSSYFFDKSTHLRDNYIRKDDKTEQRWTQEWVSGPKLIDVPIYILLSNFSYSSAEVFSYQLQQLGRAMIIGEKTRGGVHGVKYLSFQELSINLRVPYSRDINPYSKTNYIDGIIPNIAVSSEKALVVANIEAAKQLLETESDSKKRYKLTWVLSGYEADLDPMYLDEVKLSEFVGIYGNVQLTLGCGKLYLHRKNNAQRELVPMRDDLFKYKDQEEAHYRIQFIRDKKGAVIGFFEHDSDGDRYPVNKRTEGGIASTENSSPSPTTISVRPTSAQRHRASQGKRPDPGPASLPAYLPI